MTEPTLVTTITKTVIKTHIVTTTVTETHHVIKTTTIAEPAQCPTITLEFVSVG